MNKFKEIKVRVGFKQRGSEIFGNIAKVDGVWKGVSAFNEDSIILMGNSYTRPKVMYDCTVLIDSYNNATLVFADRINFDYTIQEIVKKNQLTIKVTIGEKTLFYDPIVGNSKYSTTPDGLLRAIKIMPDNFAKSNVIREVLMLFKKHNIDVNA